MYEPSLCILLSQFVKNCPPLSFGWFNTLLKIFCQLHTDCARWPSDFDTKVTIDSLLRLSIHLYSVYMMGNVIVTCTTTSTSRRRNTYKDQVWDWGFVVMCVFVIYCSLGYIWGPSYFYDFPIIFWSCSHGVVFLVFHFIVILCVILLCECKIFV